MAMSTLDGEHCVLCETPMGQATGQERVCKACVPPPEAPKPKTKLVKRVNKEDGQLGLL